MATTGFPRRSTPDDASAEPATTGPTPTDEPNASRDAALVRALETDPMSALAALYDRYGRLVYGLALAVLASPAEAEDVTQEVFLALGTRRAYDPGRGSLSAFLITITRSRAIDRLRGARRRLRLLERPPASLPAPLAPDPVERLDLEERAQRVRAALSELPERPRQVLELAYYRDLSQSEIAVELAAPLGTVKSWARQGLMGLRHRLGELVAP